MSNKWAKEKTLVLLINGESSCVILIGHESGRRKYIEVRKERKKYFFFTHSLLVHGNNKNILIFTFKVNEKINGDKF